MNKDVKIPMLKLLVVIIDREQTKKINEIFQQEHLHLHFECLGEGTAGSEVLDLLGLGSIDKSVILCVTPERRANELLEITAQKMQLHRPGTGIAFIITLSGVSNTVFQILDEDVRNKIKSEMEKEVEKMKSNATHDLIMAVINQGYTEELMAAARAAGATGGTVVHARGVGLEETVKFFGISVQPEKEIVLIVTTHENRQNIMKSICQACGMKTEAKGIVISLPVDDVSNL